MRARTRMRAEAVAWKGAKTRAGENVYSRLRVIVEMAKLQARKERGRGCVRERDCGREQTNEGEGEGGVSEGEVIVEMAQTGARGVMGERGGSGRPRGDGAGGRREGAREDDGGRGGAGSCGQEA